MRKIIEPYYVLNWDFNRKNVEYYDIMPYLIGTYNEEKTRKFRVFHPSGEPTTFAEFREFILEASKYQFWSRCEYEVIISQWPYDENDPLKYSKKIDVYDQIKNNIDVITRHFMNQLQNS